MNKNSWDLVPVQRIGRFAPSATGPLHFGSLVAAVGSYLHAKSQGGMWQLRIEDVDRPRIIAGAAEAQIAALSAYGFEWDGPVIWQSDHSEIYQTTLTRLVAAGLAYPCLCTRSQIASASKIRIGIDDALIYSGTCRHWQPSDPVPSGAAWRFRVPTKGAGNIRFRDQVQGSHHQYLPESVGDFVLLRADGCFTYQLAVVVDDLLQKITEVVRGADLIDSTPRQIALIQALGGKVPSYVHLPIVVNAAGEKLSKQTRAAGIPVASEAERVRQLWLALVFLGQMPTPELQRASQQTLWAWALAQWSLSSVPAQGGSLPEFVNDHPR